MSKTKFRDLPVGARFMMNGFDATFEKIAGQSQPVNCKNLSTQEVDWVPGSKNVVRVIASSHQGSFLAELTAAKEEFSAAVKGVVYG